jgi:serine-type D-Ala-D-Ala carboxypeptidase/endopeptidase (penicillin-binding protein 4)
MLKQQVQALLLMKIFTFFSFNKPAKLFILAIIYFIITACQSSKPLPFTEYGYKEKLANSRVFQSGFTGFALFDPATNTMLHEYNATKYFIPASNTKLITFFAGLKLLNDSVPAIKYTISGDSLIFKGTGDPSFLHPDIHNIRTYQFLNQSTQKLYYTPSDYVSPRYGPGWAWDDYNFYYSTERAPFPIYGNFVRFKIIDNQQFPAVNPPYFLKSIRFTQTNSSNLPIEREIGQNNFFFNQLTPFTFKTKDIPFIYTPEILVELLNDTLSNKVTLINEVEHPLTQVFYSIKLDTLYKKMLQDSDNFIAEQVLLLCASSISDSLNAESAIKYMLQHHLNQVPDKLKWVDGSGLSRYNLLTPRSLIYLLNQIYKEVSQDRLFELFPEGGKTGTLKSWNRPTSAFIHAKTGSMTNTQNLSGYIITKSGKTLIFSFMNNNQTVTRSELRQEMEEVLEKVYYTY